MRTLSPAQQELLRKREMAAVLREGMTDEAAAALFGVSSKSIGSWRARYEADGEAGTGKLYFTILKDTFDAKACIAFLDKLIDHFAGQKIHLVLDRHSVHTSKAVIAWVQARRGRSSCTSCPPTPHTSTPTNSSTPS